MSVTVTRSPVAGLDTAGKTSLGSMVTPGWFIAAYLHVTSDNATTEIQTIFSSGALVAGAFNLGYGGPGHPDPNTVHCTLGSSTTRYKIPAGSLPLGWKGYVVAQRAPAGNLSLYWVPVQTTAPTDDSAVQSALNLVSTTSQLTQLTRTQVAIGMRGDAVRGCDQTIGRAVMGSGNLTKLEMARLAFGEEITDLGKSPLVYVRLDTPSDITDRGSDANVFTQTGTFTQGPAPGWGYVPAVPSAPAFTDAPVIDATPVVGAAASFTRGTAGGYPTPTRTQQWMLDGSDISGATGLTYTPVAGDVGKTLTLRDTATNASAPSGVSSTSAGRTVAAQATGVNAVAEIAHKVIQRLPVRTGTTAPVALSGTYDGAAVAADVRLLAADGTTVLQDWTPITGASFANQVWSGSVLANTGGPYLHQVRFKDAGGSVIGMTPVATNVWNVGALMAIGGSSGGEGWFTTGTFTARSDVYKFRFGAWSSMGGTSNGPMCLMANALAVRLGMPVGVIAYAASGTTLEEWSRSDTVWTSFANAVTQRGGKVEAMLFTAGSNDANESGVDSYDTHLFRVRRLLQMLRDLVADQNLPILWTGFNRRQSANQAQSDMVREVENTISDDANVTLVQTLDLPLQTDNAHLTGDGYATTMLRGNFQWPYISGGTEKNSPRITAFEYSGSTVTATIAHGSGNDFVPSTGASGFTVSDANGARTIVSAERVDATHLRITCDQALVAPVVTKHLAGAAPIVTAPVLDNGTVPLPLSVQTKLATVESGTVPVPIVESVTVTPASASIQGGATLQLNAVVNGLNSPSQAVTWSVASGSISIGGLFTAPAATTSAQTISGTATSVQDPTKSGAFTIAIPAIVVVPDPDPEPEPEPEPNPQPRPVSMQKYMNAYLGPTDLAIRKATVTVTKADGTPAVIHSDNGETPITSLLTGDDGEFAFYAENGRYNITLKKRGLRDETVTDVQIFDPADDPGVREETLAAATGSSLMGFKQASVSASSRTVQDKLRESVSVKDFGAVGDGVADDRAAFIAADAASLGPVTVPPGNYRLSSSPPLTKPLDNMGATVTTDTGSWLPRFERSLGRLYDFIKKVNPTESYTGTPTAYTYLKDLCASYLKLVSAAGYQQSFGSDSGGRTLIPISYVEGNHGGMGDMNGYQAAINVTPHSRKDDVTKWVGQNSATGHSAQVSAGGAQVNLYGMEHHLYDEGFGDVTAIGGVFNFRRTGVDTKPYSTPWIGWRLQNFGTTGCDSGYQLAGDWKVGLDFTDADFDAEKCAVALKPGDRIYWGADPISTASDQWFAGDGAATLGGTFTELSGGKLKDVVDGVAIFQIASTSVQVRPGVNNQFSTQVFGVAANPFLGFGQIDAISYIGAASQGTDSTTFAIYVAQAGVEVNALVIPSVGDLQAMIGNVAVMTVGKGLRVKEGTNAKQGVATLVAGTVTVANTSVTANSRIFPAAQDGNTVGALRITKTAGTGFTITSSNAADSGVVAYQIFEPA